MMTNTYSSSSTLVSSLMSPQQWMNFPGIQARLNVTPHYFPFYDSLNYTFSCFKLCRVPLQINPTKWPKLPSTTLLKNKSIMPSKPKVLQNNANFNNGDPPPHFRQAHLFYLNDLHWIVGTLACGVCISCMSLRTLKAFSLKVMTSQVHVC